MSKQGDIYALLVGVNDYECEAVRRLHFAVADVVAFRLLLTERMGLKPENSVLLSYPAVESARTPRRAEVLAPGSVFGGPDALLRTRLCSISRVTALRLATQASLVDG